MAKRPKTSKTPDDDGNLQKQYADMLALYEKAQALVAKEGLVKFGGKNGAPYPHPAIGVMNTCLKQMRAIEKAVKANGAGKAKPKDTFEDLD